MNAEIQTTEMQPKRFSRLRLALAIVAGLLAFGVIMVGVSFAVGHNRLHDAMAERGLCQPGACAQAVVDHLEEFTEFTGNPSELYRYCLGTQEIATHSFDYKLGFVVPAIRLLMQWPCHTIYEERS